MIPTFRRFTLDDFPDAPDYLNSVFDPLNLFAEQTVQVLTKSLVIGENIQGQKYQTSFSTGANYTTGTFTPIVLPYIGGGSPNICLIGRIIDQSGATILTPVSITGWYLDTNKSPATIVISYIAGLGNSKKYQVNILAL
jgi:hypothetical protein